LTELKEICTLAQKWGKLPDHSCGIVRIYRNQTRKVETTLLKKR